MADNAHQFIAQVASQAAAAPVEAPSAAADPDFQDVPAEPAPEVETPQDDQEGASGEDQDQDDLGNEAEEADTTLNLSSYRKQRTRAEAAEARAEALAAQVASIPAMIQAEVAKLTQTQEATNTEAAEAQAWEAQKADFTRRTAEFVRELIDEGRYDEANAALAESHRELAQAEAERASNAIRTKMEREAAQAAEAQVHQANMAYAQANPGFVADLKVLDDFEGLIDLGAVKKGAISAAQLHQLAQLVKAGLSGTPAGIQAQVNAQGQAAAAQALAQGVRRRVGPGVGAIPSASADMSSTGPTAPGRDEWWAAQPPGKASVPRYIAAVAAGKAR